MVGDHIVRMWRYVRPLLQRYAYYHDCAGILIRYFGEYDLDETRELLQFGRFSYYRCW
jgi:hypothetical protein